MIISDHIHIMMHLASSLKQFTPKSVADPSKTTGAILSLNCSSRLRVDELVALAVANGGAAYDSAQDLGFIYTHGFTDVDGNVWRVNWLNPDVSIPN
jgi:predicted lactoylglutathione lyase